MFTPKPKRLVLIRHGESAHNALPKEGGIITAEAASSKIISLPDHLMPLSERGQEQAIVTGQHISKIYGLTPDVIYHSYYERTVRTMDLILESYEESDKLNLKIRGNPNLGERQSGYIYGMTREEIDLYFPYYQAYLQREGYFMARPPGGESQFDVIGRVYGVIGEIIKNRANQTVWVVCHGGIIRAFRFILERWTPAKYLEDVQACENCALTIYDFDEASKQLVLSEYNKWYW